MSRSPRPPYQPSTRRAALWRGGRGRTARPLLSLALLVPLLGLLACSPPDESVPGQTCDYRTAGTPARPVDPPPTTGVTDAGTVAYTLAMTGGEVTLTMDRAVAPCTVNSFVSLAEQGYFDRTRCHRLADSGIFVLQCGDPTGTGSGGPGYAFDDETRGGESYTRGVVAMANAGPGTNGSQFFLVWDDSTAVLDRAPNYTIFARMDAASRDVVAQMAGEGQDGSNEDGTGRPNNPSEIARVTKAAPPEQGAG